MVTASGIYAAAYSSTQITIPPPTIDTAWYANARPGPTTGCNDDPTHPADPAYMSTYPSGYTASTFKSALFDNNSTMSNPPSLGSVDFLNFGSFDCRYYDSNGDLVGRLKWQSGSPGTLTILGTIWIDGNLSFAGNRTTPSSRAGGRSTPPARSRSAARQTSARHRRRGIPASATTTRTRTCSCSSRTTTAVTAQRGSRSTGQNTFEGIAFTNGILNEGGNATLHGPVLADTAIMAGNGDTRTIINPPPGAPGAAYDETTNESGDDTAVWADVPGSWQQLR